MKHLGNDTMQVATANPAEFPLGSPGSRAAARVMYDAKHSLSDDDLRCLAVWHVASLEAPGAPTSGQAHGTEPYNRGWELIQQRNPIIPSHLDPMDGKRCLSCYVFHDLHERWPKNGDVMRYSELEAAFDPNEEANRLEVYREAWEAKLPSLAFPLRMEGRHIFILEQDFRTKETRWIKKCGAQPAPECEWRDVEYDVLKSAGLIPPKMVPEEAAMPITPAVVFSIDADGTYRVAPYTN